MQSVRASWAGTTFALPRCSDSRDKKRRSRRTKEERKTMVDSFIKKYQNSNNGKFPSLNLTHKEVGGSFYTVREIVREIIQENRVLGPGHSTSKALNLEYCPEELAGESLPMDISASMSISTSNHTVAQRQGENFPSSNDYNRDSAEMIEADESVNEESFESHPNVTYVSQVLDGEQYHGTHLNGRLENLSYKEPNLDKLSRVVNENSGVCENTHAEVQVCGSSNPGKVEHSVSMFPSLFESVVNGDDNGDRRNGMTREVNSSEASSSRPLSDSSSENNISLDSVATCASPCGIEDPPREAAGAKACNLGKSEKIIGVTTSFEVEKTSDSEDVGVVFMPLEKGSVINRSETTETLSSIVVDEVSGANPSRQLSLEKDSVIDRPESLSSTAVDEVSNRSLNASVSQYLDSPALDNTRPMVHPLFQPNDVENVITNNKSTPGESTQPSLKGKAFSEVKHQHEPPFSNTAGVESSDSISQNEVRRESEINPLWDAIKSLLNAVVKFWTE